MNMFHQQLKIELERDKNKLKKIKLLKKEDYVYLKHCYIGIMNITENKYNDIFKGYQDLLNKLENLFKKSNENNRLNKLLKICENKKMELLNFIEWDERIKFNLIEKNEITISQLLNHIVFSIFDSYNIDWNYQDIEITDLNKLSEKEFNKLLTILNYIFWNEYKKVIDLI